MQKIFSLPLFLSLSGPCVNTKMIENVGRVQEATSLWIQLQHQSRDPEKIQTGGRIQPEESLFCTSSFLLDFVESTGIEYCIGKYGGREKDP